MVETPARRNHLRHVSALRGSHCDFGDVWAQVQHECVETGAQADRTGDSEDDPVEAEVGDLAGFVEAFEGVGAVDGEGEEDYEKPMPTRELKDFLELLEGDWGESS